MSKMKNCNVCQNEIAKSAKVCPECGAKQKKPIFKKWWFWAVIAIIFIALVSGGEESDDTSSSSTSNATQQQEVVQEEEIVYEEVTVDQLESDLEENALSASKTYKGKHLQITGTLSVIDSNGQYISLKSNDMFSISPVMCYIKGDEQKDYVATLSKEQEVTVKVKVTDVGEFLGYSTNVVEFVK